MAPSYDNCCLTRSTTCTAAAVEMTLGVTLVTSFVTLKIATDIQKARVSGLQTPQIILAFPRKITSFTVWGTDIAFFLIFSFCKLFHFCLGTRARFCTFVAVQLLQFDCNRAIDAVKFALQHTVVSELKANSHLKRSS